MSFDNQVFFDPADIANIDDNLDSIGAYLVGGDKAILDKENDVASATDDRGLAIMAIRKDSAAALADTDGDYSFLQVDDSGRLRVDASVSIDMGAEKDEDSAHVSGDQGNYILAVRADSRPTDANTSADGDYASFFVNNSGELWVKDADTLAQLVTIDAVLDSIKVDTGNMDTSLNAIEASAASIDADTSTIAGDTTSIDSILTALSKAEDAVHGSGDQGIMQLAVRNDSEGSLVDTDGDYAPLQVDSSGRLRVVGADTGVPDTAVENQVVSVGDTAVELASSPLSNRKRILIQNDGNKPVYLGKSDVTADNTAATGGIKLNKGGTLELELGPNVSLYGINTSSNTSDVRILEIA